MTSPLAARSGRASLACSVVALGLVVGCLGSAERATRQGDAHLRDNRLVDAELAYNRAIRLDPHYGPALYGKGWSLYLSGHSELMDAARQLFQRCVDYDPDYWGGYRGLGVTLMDEGKIALAERMLRTAFDKNPQEPTVLISLGQLYLDADRPESASPLFEAAIALAPERGEFLRMLAEIELRAGRFDAALALLAEGRARPVGGRAGLLLLDEGELRVHLARASALAEGATSPDDPALDQALQALDAADSLMEKAISEDPRVRDPGARRKYHARLRQQIVSRGVPRDVPAALVPRGP